MGQHRGSAGDALFSVTDVTRRYWGVTALAGVSIEIARGEVHAITGENGAGKSTLMRILAGLDAPDSGEVIFRGCRVAMIHQELLPFPDLTVAENISIGREPVCGPWRRIDWRAINREATRLLDQLGVSIDPRSRMGDLSLAQMQAVEIARALHRDADAIIMDEPTSALTGPEAEALFRVIFDLKRRGAAILYVSHRMEEIFRLADRVTVLRDGRTVATRVAGETTADEIIPLMVGREVLEASKPAVQLRGVALEVKRLGRRGSFHDITFMVERGEIVGLAGLMGAGRTGVAEAVYGLAPADSGEILVSGRPARIASPADALASGIAMVTEDRKKYGLAPDLSVKHNLTLAALARYCRGPVIRRDEETRAAVERIRALGVRTTGVDGPVKHLSGGNQQKVVIAKALLTQPSVLILDEPTRGIDVGAKAEIHALILRLAAEGKAVLLVSSEMNEILALCDRILVMRDCGIAAELRPGETNPEEILRYAMAG